MAGTVEPGHGAQSVHGAGYRSDANDWVVVNTKLVSKILGLASLSWAATLIAPAQAVPSFGDCAKQIERRGYVIYDMDQRGPGYEADVVKDGRRWDLRLDQTCKVLDERLD